MNLKCLVNVILRMLNVYWSDFKDSYGILVIRAKSYYCEPIFGLKTVFKRLDACAYPAERSRKHEKISFIETNSFINRLPGKGVC